MLQGLVLIGLIVAMVLLWRRQDELEMRLTIYEGLSLPSEPVSPMVEPAPPASPRAAKPPEATARVVAPPPPPTRRETEPKPAIMEWPAEVEELSMANIGFEELFGRRLPIWAGGITLAIAGVLIVRFSIEAGLFPPVVRVLGGLLFGLLLIAAAEAAHRHTEQVRDPRIAQALSGAGLATLYASILIASNLYHLVSPVTAFVGLAGVTGGAMGLALRFGSPSALLGLVGGLAAPALTASGPANVPLLALYLTLVVGGLFAVSRRQRWTWLGLGALAGGLGWGGLMIANSTLDAIATSSTGLYLLLIGFAFPAMAAASEQGQRIRLAGSAFAALEVAALVACGGFALLNWGLFGLISIAMLWLSRTDRRLSALPALGLAIALALIAAWPHPALGAFSAVLAATILIYGAAAFLFVWKEEGSIVEAGTIAVLGLAGFGLPLLHYHGADRAQNLPFAGLALICAGLPALAALLGWTSSARRGDARFAALATASAVLVAAAAILALPLWAIPMAVGTIGFATLLLGLTSSDSRLAISAWTMAGIAALLLVLDPAILDELARSCGLIGQVTTATAVPRWAGFAIVLAGYAWKGDRNGAVHGAQAAAALALYIAIAQIVPGPWLALVPAAAIPVLALCSRALDRDRLIAAVVIAIGLSFAWAVGPFVTWTWAALASLAGRPMLLVALPSLHDTLVRLVIPSAALLTIRTGSLARRETIAVVALPGVVALHILYKHVFALGTGEAFIRYGLAERTVWEGLLLGSAFVAWQLRPRFEAARPAAIALAAAALAHAGWYTVLIHDPLWSAQEVGSLPVLNGVLAAYAVPLAGLWMTGRAFPAAAFRIERARSIAQMVLILLFGVSELQQVFHGTLLSVGGVTADEDALRSVGAVATAIGFLLWGLRDASPSARSWRIGSLVLMLAAACKVFLIDAAGLDGLLRIASFVALGFSLIGIGWLYSRYLKVDPSLTAQQ